MSNIIEVTGPNSSWQTALSSTGLSIRALAREAGISHTYLRAIVASRQLPSESVRLRLLDRFQNYRSEDLFGSLVPVVQTTALAIICKRCHSPRIIRSGLLQGVQRYQCKNCGSVFLDNHAPLHGRLPVDASVVVMEHFFAGESLDSIRTLVQESKGIQITVSGLERMVYRLSRKAVRLAGDILPEIHLRWVLDGAEISGATPVAVLDVLDLDSGFIIASDVIRQDYREKGRESVLQKALRITGLIPETIILGAGAYSAFSDVEGSVSFQKIEYNSCQEVNMHRYTDSINSKIQLLSRRMSFDSVTNHRLLCAAWRVHYNFLSDLKPAAVSPYQSWSDIINASDYPQDY